MVEVEVVVIFLEGRRKTKKEANFGKKTLVTMKYMYQRQVMASKR